MRTRLALTIVLIQITSLAQSQKISGKVSDTSNNPLPYVNLVLLNPADSSMIEGSITNLNGLFSLEGIRSGNYLLAASMVGFKTKTTSIYTTGDQTLESIVLEEDPMMLNEVVVKADKPLFEQTIDKLVVNLENSIVSAGGSVLDVLERSPGISVARQSGSISMNGKQGVQVMLNGKLQRLPLSMVVQQLEGVSSSSVQKIELISNPSSRYDAEGDAGIINIITKKNTDYGTNGTATLGTGYSDYSGYFKPTGSFNINHKWKTVSVYINYSINSDRRWQQWNYERQVSNPDLYSNTVSDRYVRWPIQRSSAGAEWTVSKRTSVHALVSGFSDLWKMESYNHSYISQNGLDSAHIELYDREVNHWKHLMGNLNLSHVFKNGSKLNVDADYLYYHDHNPNNFINDYTFYQTNLVIQKQVRTSKETPIHMGVFKLDFEKQLKTMKIEAGLKSSFSELKNFVKLENLEGETWIADTKFTQNYLLNDNANAAYAAASGELGKKGQFQLGLRAESTDMKMSTTQERIFELDFWKLFPTAFYTWKVNTKSAWQFSYGRRITRPSYSNVAPWVIFMDPFTYYWGNPRLKPAISDGVQATYSHNALLLMFKYSHDRNAIAGNQSRYNAEEKKTYIYADNVDLLQLYSLSATLPVTITKWWTVQNDALLTYQKINHVYQDTPLVLKQYSVRLSLNQNFVLPYNFSFELSGVYVAPRRVGLSLLKSAGSVSAGIQKKTKNGGKLNLTITDIFWTRNSIYVNNNPVLKQIQKTSYYNEPRVLRLSYTFNFGNGKMKSGKQRSTASDAEQQRVN